MNAATTSQAGGTPGRHPDAKFSRPDLPLLVVKRNSVQAQQAATPGRHRWLVAIVTLVLAGLVAVMFGTGSALQEWFPEADAEAKVPSSPTAIFALGRLEPLGEVISVAAPFGAGDARISKLPICEGDAVRQNDVLAVLDNEAQLKAAVDVATEQLQQARLRLEQTRLVIRTTQAQLEASVRSAEASQAIAIARWNRQQRLTESAATSQEELDEARLALQTAEETVHEAQSKLERYQVTGDAELVDITLGRQDVAVAQASLQQARANLQQAYVRAPIDGTVLKIHLRSGERIGQSAILDLGATQSMMARLEIYESDIPRLYENQSVSLTASTFDDPLRGHVERIATWVQKQSVVDANPAANTDARVVEVWVRLDPESSKRASRFVNLQVRAEISR